jgi:hypothetical protein
MHIPFAAALLALAPPAVAQPAPALNPCSYRGAGFVEVPGTATCVKVSGSTVAEVGAGKRSAIRSGVGGTASVDARTDTEIGPVRGFVRLKTGQGIAREPQGFR